MTGWADITAALDRACLEGRRLNVWLRDDDAVTVTPALQRLDRLCAGFGLPVLLAVIPQPATPALADWVAERPGVTPCQHGFAHRNHAPPGARAVELGGRPPRVVLDELEQGRALLQELFGRRLAPILVPPWNRIDPEVIPHLRAAGYAALSTFGPKPAGHGLATLNADLDIIDWRAGRRGRDLADLAGKFVRLIEAAQAQGQAIGILTHHLAHDDQAWAVLEAILSGLQAHPAVNFAEPAALLSGPPQGLRPGPSKGRRPL